MRVFLCSFGYFSVAIPMNSVSSLALHDDKTLKASVSDEGEAGVNYRENRNTYVPLPQLFNLPPGNIRHNITLKEPNTEDSSKGRTVLLIPEVECETEIPDDKIFPLPKALGGTRFSELFSGIQFDSRPAASSGSLILMLSGKQLIQSTQKEKPL